MIIANSIVNGGTLYLAGNGGSAAIAEHVEAELMGRLVRDRLPIPAISLTSNSATLTCIANDFGYENVFSRQLEALCSPLDVFVGFSTSGRSRNIIKAIQTCFGKNAACILFTGLGFEADNTWGKPNKLTTFIIPTLNTANIQLAHLAAIHPMCSLIENQLFSDSSNE